ncbi:hypothetical protein Hdeb2414_s0002g00063561 [Helianthus debilis subsp. tardiflorus]
MTGGSPPGIQVVVAAAIFKLDDDVGLLPSMVTPVATIEPLSGFNDYNDPF